MKALGAVLVALALVGGCAKPDWIERTLVTVDVTGTWSGFMIVPTSSGDRPLSFELKQAGSRVTGFVSKSAAWAGVPADITGPIEGTISGDSFEFWRPGTAFGGKMTVAADEMTGVTYGHSNQAGRISVRRGEAASTPASSPAKE